MDREEIWAEYQANGRVSGRAMRALREMLRAGDDPYRAISLAGDVAAFQLAADIAPHLDSEDDMVRWIAAGVLFGRFRDVRLAPQCLDLLKREQDTVVRGSLLTGAGELLPLLEDEALRERLARELLRVLKDPSESPEMRETAYGGIEAAMGIPPLERSPAHKRLDPEKDYRPEIIAGFIEAYGLEC